MSGAPSVRREGAFAMPLIAGRPFEFGTIKRIARSALRPPEAGRDPLLLVFAIVCSVPYRGP